MRKVLNLQPDNNMFVTPTLRSTGVCKFGSNFTARFVTATTLYTQAANMALVFIA